MDPFQSIGSCLLRLVVISSQHDEEDAALVVEVPVGDGFLLISQRNITIYQDSAMPTTTKKTAIIAYEINHTRSQTHVHPLCLVLFLQGGIAFVLQGGVASSDFGVMSIALPKR
jgi:hypothetical protein